MRVALPIAGFLAVLTAILLFGFDARLLSVVLVDLLVLGFITGVPIFAEVLLFAALGAYAGATETPTVQGAREEIVEGVEDMQLEYLEAGDDDFGAETTVGDWGRVIAVRIRLQMTGTEGALTGNEIRGQNGEVLGRVMTHVVNLRNREDLL